MEILKKVVLSIGMNDKDEHKQIIADLEAHEIIMKSVASAGIIGGTLIFFTTKSGNIGMYNGEIEKSCELVLYDVARENVLVLCDILKMALNQESVAVEVVKNIDVMFI